MTPRLPLRTLTMTIRLPRDVYERWQTQGGAQAALEAQGLWPEQVESFRWYADPTGLPAYIAELEVVVDLFED